MATAHSSFASPRSRRASQQSQRGNHDSSFQRTPLSRNSSSASGRICSLQNALLAMDPEVWEAASYYSSDQDNRSIASYSTGMPEAASIVSSDATTATTTTSSIVPEPLTDKLRHDISQAEEEWLLIQRVFLKKTTTTSIADQAGSEEKEEGVEAILEDENLQSAELTERQRAAAAVQEVSNILGPLEMALGRVGRGNFGNDYDDDDDEESRIMTGSVSVVSGMESVVEEFASGRYHHSLLGMLGIQLPPQMRRQVQVAATSAWNICSLLMGNASINNESKLMVFLTSQEDDDQQHQQTTTER